MRIHRKHNALAAVVARPCLFDFRAIVAPLPEPIWTKRTGSALPAFAAAIRRRSALLPHR
jgi:hypothetical protein